MQKHYGVSPEELSHVAGLLRSGQIVALPTETVYGLACLALNKFAVAKVFKAKKRPAHDPLIIHVSDLTEAKLVCRPDSRAMLLIESFWPGPLTLVLPKTRIVPAIVTSGLSTVAVRSPAHPVFREVLNLVSAPLAAPSANPFGKVSPTRAEHIEQSFGDGHPPVVDGGPTKIGIESTVVDLSSSRTRILRPGPIDTEAISERPPYSSTLAGPSLSGSLMDLDPSGPPRSWTLVVPIVWQPGGPPSSGILVGRPILVP